MALLLLIIATVIAWLVLVPPPWFARPVTVHVIRVFDGDTITVQTADRPRQSIRLAQIDAPERRQPGGIAARDALRALVLDRDVTLYPVATDQYGRTVARVQTANGDDVARQMARQGHAWAYWAHLGDPVVPVLEWRAWLLGLGLWHKARFSAQAPWQFRSDSRKRTAAESRAD